MDRVEASGKTVDDALRKALALLGASAEEVEFVVLDEGQRGGLFGRGSRDAVVRVERLAEPHPAQSAPGLPDTRIPRSRRSSEGGRSSGRGRRLQGGGPRAPLDQPAPKLADEHFRPVEPRARTVQPPPRPARPPRTTAREGPEIEPDINAEEVDFAASVVDDLLRLLNIAADITIREPLSPGDGRGSALAVIDLAGEDLGLLIGRKGETLLALQYLVNLILARRYPGKGVVTVDVEHYRHRREDQLVALAQRMAERVRRTGSPITLEPMSPAERRLIHLALAEEPDLETNSVGEGDNRKVVISFRA